MTYTNILAFLEYINTQPRVTKRIEYPEKMLEEIIRFKPIKIKHDGITISLRHPNYSFEVWYMHSEDIKKFELYKIEMFLADDY